MAALSLVKTKDCLLCYACQCHSMDSLQLLVANGLSRKHLCQDDVSALHVSSSVGFLSGLPFLLSDHYDKTVNNALNINGVTLKSHHTPLYYAAHFIQPQSVSYLLSKGARLDIPDSTGRFPLHIAIMKRDLECVSLLLDHQHLSKTIPLILTLFGYQNHPYHLYSLMIINVPSKMLS